MKKIIDNYICSKQTPDEIENDIIEIKKLIEPRKMIIVTHYNSLIHGKYITSRNNLINNIIKICKKMNIPVINPTDILTAYRQEEVIKPFMYMRINNKNHHIYEKKTKKTSCI